MVMGWAAVRANIVPMFVLWGLAVVLVLGYYFMPGVASCLAPLAKWQVESGWLAAFVNRFVFCGVLPGIFMLTLPRLRPRFHPVMTVCATAVFCGVFGIFTDWFFRLQGAWFGQGHDFSTLLVKTAVDQFVWNVLVVTPCVSVFYFWLACGLSVRRACRTFPRNWIRMVYAPNLLTNWCIWIPVVLATYAFPLPLQIQVSGLISAFWILVCLKLGRTGARDL